MGKPRSGKPRGERRKVVSDAGVNAVNGVIAVNEVLFQLDSVFWLKQRDAQLDTLRGGRSRALAPQTHRRFHFEPSMLGVCTVGALDRVIDE